jgi:5S rRNA maturation endonuclease (ribonuclease M5)
MKDLTDLPTIQADSLGLNSVAFFEKSRQRMDQYSNIHLFLDRDRMGVKCPSRLSNGLQNTRIKVDIITGFKDLNDCLIKSVSPQLKQSHKRGRHL